jgi:glycosyltransferase involved in cell wall biosynthesis
MKVSFVIPTRNQAPFIRRCLDGCLAQGLPDAEILVVDGASTDGTQEILASYGERIRWTSQPDSGQAQAVNRGIARASGEIVAWINSDDFYEGPGVLPVVVAAFEADPELDILYGGATVVDARGATIRRFRSRAFRRPADLLVNAIGPAQPATFFRRELFQRVGGLKETLHFGLDYDLFLRMFPAARKTRYLAESLARMTFHSGAKSIYGLLDQVRELVALKREQMGRFSLGSADRARLWWGVASLYAYWAAVRLGLRRVGIGPCGLR